MSKLEITSQERSALRATAHPLRPVVLIGDRGLSESVIKEIDVHLTAHKLIKIRIGGEDREAREAMLQTICDTLSCASVHHLGKTLIIYRPDPVAAAAEAEAHNATRAQRKPSEPYTSKKQAASGVNLTRKGEIAKRAAQKTERLENAAPKVQNAAPKARRAQAAADDTSAHRIPRRAGSALSLRAGSRRNSPGGRAK